MESTENPASDCKETRTQLVELAAEAFARILWQQITRRTSKLGSIKGKEKIGNQATKYLEARRISESLDLKMPI